MAINKVEKQKKIGAYVMQNQAALENELEEMDDALKFEGQDLQEACPKLAEFRDLIKEPEDVSTTQD